MLTGQEIAALKATDLARWCWPTLLISEPSACRYYKEHCEVYQACRPSSKARAGHLHSWLLSSNLMQQMRHSLHPPALHTVRPMRCDVGMGMHRITCCAAESSTCLAGPGHARGAQAAGSLWDISVLTSTPSGVGPSSPSCAQCQFPGCAIACRIAGVSACLRAGHTRACVDRWRPQRGISAT
jgi:hypothetical protein